MRYFNHQKPVLYRMFIETLKAQLYIEPLTFNFLIICYQMVVAADFGVNLNKKIRPNVALLHKTPKYSHISRIIIIIFAWRANKRYA